MNEEGCSCLFLVFWGICFLLSLGFMAALIYLMVAVANAIMNGV
jgi:hypothetical protein